MPRAKGSPSKPGLGDFPHNASESEILALLGPDTRAGQAYAALSKNEDRTTYEVTKQMEGFDALSPRDNAKTSSVLGGLRALGLILSSRAEAGSRKLTHRIVPHPLKKPLPVAQYAPPISDEHERAAKEAANGNGAAPAPALDPELYPLTTRLRLLKRQVLSELDRLMVDVKELEMARAGAIDNDLQAMRDQLDRLIETRGRSNG